VVVALIAVGMGIAAAGSRGTGLAPGGTSTGTDTSTGTSMGSGMTGGAPSMMGDTSTSSGMMDGTSGMMGSTDMEAMHEQMMASMAGKVPAKMLARCNALHDRMMGTTGGSTGTDHASHHGGTGSTG